MFRPYRRGNLSVHGCSPGCIALSLGISLALTLLVNACIRVV
jgi:hypothetical protein